MDSAPASATFFYYARYGHPSSYNAARLWREETSDLVTAFNDVQQAASGLRNASEGLRDFDSVAGRIRALGAVYRAQIRDEATVLPVTREVAGTLGGLMVRGDRLGS